MASNFYRAPDSPRYILGHSLELGFVLAGIIAAVILNVLYMLANKSRARKRTEDGYPGMTSLEMSELGDKAPTFRYMH